MTHFYSCFRTTPPALAEMAADGILGGTPSKNGNLMVVSTLGECACVNGGIFPNTQNSNGYPNFPHFRSKEEARRFITHTSFKRDEED